MNPILTAIAEHLGLPEGSLADWRKTPDDVSYMSYTMPRDPVFGPRTLFAVTVGDKVYVLRVMTHPLQNKPAVYTETVL